MIKKQIIKKSKHLKSFGSTKKKLFKSPNLKFARKKLLLIPKYLKLRKVKFGLKKRRFETIGVALNKYGLILRELSQQASCNRLRTKKIFRRLRFGKFLNKRGRKFFKLYTLKRYFKLANLSTKFAYISGQIRRFRSKFEKDLIYLKKSKDLKSMSSHLILSKVARGYLARRQLYGRIKAKKWLLLQFGNRYHPGKGSHGRAVLAFYRFNRLSKYKKVLRQSKRRRWARISWHKFVNSKYFIMLRQTANNCFVTITTKVGKVLYVCSTGLVGFKGPRRTTQPAAEAVGSAVAKFILRRRLYNLGVILRTPVNFQIRSIVAGLEFKRIHYSGIIDLVPTAHNGIRKRKARRV